MKFLRRIINQFIPLLITILFIKCLGDCSQGGSNISQINSTQGVPLTYDLRSWLKKNVNTVLSERDLDKMTVEEEKIQIGFTIACLAIINGLRDGSGINNFINKLREKKKLLEEITHYEKDLLTGKNIYNETKISKLDSSYNEPNKTTYYKYKISHESGISFMSVSAREPVLPLIDELISDLLALEKSPLPILKLDKNLIKASSLHNKAMNFYKFFDHNNSANNSIASPNDRILKFSNQFASCSENLAFSIDFNFSSISQYAENSIMDLLIDEGVLDRGHRKSLLSADSLYMGAAIYNAPKEFPNNYLVTIELAK